MIPPAETDPSGLPLFEPDQGATYTLETIATLTGATPQAILHYQEQGFITPVTGGETDHGQFDGETVRTLRRIEHLRTTCQLNESGLKLILSLMDEIERLRNELRARR